MIKPESKKMVLTVGGKTVEIETGKYAKQATSSVTVKCGGTMLFIHATVSKEPFFCFLVCSSFSSFFYVMIHVYKSIL